jgi:hypothetical protein
MLETSSSALCIMVTARGILRGVISAQHVWQLGDVRGNALGLVAREASRRHVPLRLIVKLEVAKRL